MCGIVGVVSTDKVPLNPDAIDFFEQLLFHDTVRGPHSTGAMSWSKEGKAKLRWSKEAYDGPGFLKGQKWGEHKKMLIKNPPMFLFGHNRWATSGKITNTNAHPFWHPPILLMHNGTLSNKDAINKEINQEIEVDSSALAAMISKEGWRKSLDKAWGAWTLVWVDIKDQSLNLIRNHQRPLAATLVRIGGTEYTVYASEGKMLEWLIARSNRVHAYGQHTTPIEIKPNVLFSLKLNNEGKFIVSKEDYERPFVSTTPYGHSSSRRNLPSRPHWQHPYGGWNENDYEWDYPDDPLSPPAGSAGSGTVPQGSTPVPHGNTGGASQNPSALERAKLTAAGLIFDEVKNVWRMPTPETKVNSNKSVPIKDFLHHKNVLVHFYGFRPYNHVGVGPSRRGALLGKLLNGRTISYELAEKYKVEFHAITGEEASAYIGKIADPKVYQCWVIGEEPGLSEGKRVILINRPIFQPQLQVISGRCILKGKPQQEQVPQAPQEVPKSEEPKSPVLGGVPTEGVPEAEDEEWTVQDIPEDIPEEEDIKCDGCNRVVDNDDINDCTIFNDDTIYCQECGDTAAIAMVPLQHIKEYNQLLGQRGDAADRKLHEFFDRIDGKVRNIMN